MDHRKNNNIVPFSFPLNSLAKMLYLILINSYFAFTSIIKLPILVKSS